MKPSMKRSEFLRIALAAVGVTIGRITRADARQESEAGRQDHAIPTDLKIVANYGAGESNWKSWTTTILATGETIQATVDEKEKRLHLSSKQLKSLLAAIKRERYFELKKEYPTEAIDIPTLVLRVTEHNKTHEVVVSLHDPERRSPEVQRFLRVWAELLRNVPSPNAQDKPEYYVSKSHETRSP